MIQSGCRSCAQRFCRVYAANGCQVLRAVMTVKTVPAASAPRAESSAPASASGTGWTNCCAVPIHGSTSPGQAHARGPQLRGCRAPHSFQGFTYIAGHPRIALHQQLCGPCPTGQPIEPGGDHTAGKGPRKIGGELLPRIVLGRAFDVEAAAARGCPRSESVSRRGHRHRPPARTAVPCAPSGRTCQSPAGAGGAVPAAPKSESGGDH